MGISSPFSRNSSIRSSTASCAIASPTRGEMTRAREAVGMVMVPRYAFERRPPGFVRLVRLYPDKNKRLSFGALGAEREDPGHEIGDGRSAPSSYSQGVIRKNIPL